MNGPQLCRWYVFSSIQALQAEALAMIARAADKAIARSDTFRIVLSGGSTPRPLYEQLRHLKTNWNFWHIYFSDERCLPANDPERNSVMAKEAWLDHVPIPPRQVHLIPAEMGPEAAAQAYSGILRQVAMFDLALLGLGEDGHTASLFKGHEWGWDEGSPSALPVFDSPKPPSERVSLSAWRLSRTKQVIFMVTGENKREAVMNWRAGAKIPARAITPRHGVDVLAESIVLNE